MESLSPTTYILSLLSPPPFSLSFSLSAKRFFTLEEINNPITYVDMGIHFLFWCYLPLYFSLPLSFSPSLFLFLSLSLPLSSSFSLFLSLFLLMSSTIQSSFIIFVEFLFYDLLIFFLVFCFNRC